jgi:Leucine-rich repeat (LRR) protein
LGNTSTTDIIGLSMLQVFWVSYNQLSGDIPPWLWRLPNLQALDLSNNQFTGRLPDNLSHLSYFKRKHPMSNRNPTLYEDVPVILKNNLVVLQYILSMRIYIDVSMNNLEGEIPKSLGELRGLTAVNLSHNRIRGEIPMGSFSKLPELEMLDLSYNQLGGGYQKTSLH